MSNSRDYNHGRGAQYDPPNRFSHHHEVAEGEYLDYRHKHGEDTGKHRTKYLPADPKSIVNKVKSPDVGMSYSMNPYQGCEHGCVYCYARPTHEYWGFNAGLAFENKILIKQNAPELLEQHLRSRSWKGETIVLSGNTDCYQPAEKEFQLTRKCLEIFKKYQHPVGIITKNALILRDLDILKALQEQNLVKAYISITTLDEATRRLLEPRTATIKKRLQTITALRDHRIPVTAMLAPIIPGINSHEILPLAKASKEAGAIGISHTVVRLNGATGIVFEDWIRQAMPDKAEKVLSLIRACHGGQLHDSRFGIRNRGEGPVAEQIRQLINIARRRYFPDQKDISLNTTLYPERKYTLIKNEGDQLRLF